ncbi:hypothetical protein AB0I39_27995 [Kitasatospora purpeofusca]|uniref:hypothetical protein n=1 Tax=Kitasatospora purpeofusca TaxID=67352 RepID=UPI0033D03C3B
MKGPLAQFGLDLKAVRWRAGTPSYRDMAQTTGLSIGVLSEAALGESCPSWQTLCAYLRFCGVDPQDWRPRWEMLASPQQRIQAGCPVRADQRRAVSIMEPEDVRTVADFVVGLRHLRYLNDNPPLKHIASETHRGISTISELLAPGRVRLPPIDLAIAYVRALDPAAVPRWRKAWHELKIEEDAARQAAA